VGGDLGLQAGQAAWHSQVFFSTMSKSFIRHQVFFSTKNSSTTNAVPLDLHFNLITIYFPFLTRDFMGEF
jgi:hypothetical protein